MMGPTRNDESDLFLPYDITQESSEDDGYDVVMSEESADGSSSEPPVLIAENYHDETMTTESDEHDSSFSTDSEMERLVELRSVSPSSDACSTSSSSYQRPVNSSINSSSSSAAGTYHHSGSSGSSRPVASTRERKSYTAASGRSAPMRSLSPAHPSAVMSGMDDLLRPERFDRIMHMTPPDSYIQEQHSWNPDDRSLNIFVKDEDKFTFHRHPVAQSTDCIRGKIGYSRGFHVWQIEWPERQRGTHAVVGVATKTAPLHATGYTALIGTTNESYGWDITRRECHHDSKHTMTWRYPFSNSRDVYHVPDKFYCILDMDEGYMAFATDEEYLGVAFRNLKGKTLYPIVAAVWGHCEISMRYLGSLERELISIDSPPATSRHIPLRSPFRRRRSPPRPLFHSPVYKPPPRSSHPTDSPAALLAAAATSPALPFSPFSDLAKIFSFYDLQAGGTSSSSSSYSLFEPPAEWQKFDDEQSFDSPKRSLHFTGTSILDITPCASSPPLFYIPAPPSVKEPNQLFGPPLTPVEYSKAESDDLELAEPLSLSELCRRRVRIELGPQPEERIEQLALPPILKRYLMYQY